VEAKTAAGRRALREVSVAETAHEELVLTLPPALTVPPVHAPAPKPVVESPDRTLGWIVLGSGALLTLVGVTTGVMALHDQADLDKVCNPGCPPAMAETISSFRLERTLSYVSFGLGAVGLSGGTYLLLRGPSSNASGAPSAAPKMVSLAGTF
jgi:hypothetical protein